MRPVALAAVLGSLPAALAAQGAVSGRVVDERSAPVAGAQVAVVELGRAAITARDGTFSLARVPAGRYALQVRRLGFAPVARAITVGDAAIALGDVVLHDEAARVEPLVVTATRGPGDPRATPLSTATLGEEQLRREHSVAIALAAERIAGVRAVTTGEQIAKPVIRGLSGPRVLVLDGGHRLEDYSWSDEDGPSIEARLAERVEVVRGAASLLYGSDALGGVLNAVPSALPDAVGREPYSRLGLEVLGASNNTELGGALRAEGARGRLGWRLFGVGRFAEDLHAPHGKIEHTGYLSANGELAGGVRHANGTSTFRLAHYGGEFKLLESDPGATATNLRTAATEAEEEGPERKLADDRLQYTGEYLLRGMRLESRAQVQRHDLAEVSDDLARFSIPGVTLPSGGGKDQEVFHLVLSTATGELVAHHRLGGRVESTLGISGLAQRSDSKGPIFLVPDATTVSGAAFALERVTLGRLVLTAGARGDGRRLTADANTQIALPDQRRTWGAASGDVGAVLRLTDALSLAGNAGRAWRAPTLFELYANGPRLGEARYEVGDHTLADERSVEVDGALRWQSARAVAEVGVFRNTVDDFIFVAPTGAQSNGFPLWRYEQGDARLTGGEASVEVSVATPLTLRGRWDAVRATNRGTGVPLPLTPPQRFVGEAELHRAALGRLLHPSLGLEVEHLDAATRVAPNELPSAAYTLANLDAGAERVVGGRAVRVDLRVRNVGNVTYRDFLSRYKAFADDPGRNVVVRLSTGF